MKKTIFAIAAVLVLAASAFGAVKPNGLFSDNTVLQRGMRLPVWGSADDGEKVTVELQGQKVTATAHNGRWILYLNPLKAGGPFTMKINDQEIKNVLVGEVWVCSGQSNMAFQLSRADNAKAAVEAAKDPMLRLYVMPNAKKPQAGPATWNECTPETAASFSAVAYFMGKRLRESLKVPVGLINTSVGGTPIEAWTSSAALKSIPKLTRETRRSYLFNGMIAPLIPYGIKGAIWYQGEANAPRAYEYRTLMPLMIKQWRTDWAQGDFPFLIVQLAPFGAVKRALGSWPELREAQLLTIQRTPKTAMAVITDAGTELNIHPPQKEPVGNRLALAARAIAYGEKIPYSGPIYKAMKIEGGKAVLSFDHVEGGLLAKSGLQAGYPVFTSEVTGFTICGDDRKFVPAKAEIKGDTVVVSSPDVPKPVAVRYGWSDWMVVNLWNRADLPASPFRTDDFEMMTKPK